MILITDISVVIRRYWVLILMVLLMGCNVTADEKAAQSIPDELASLVWVNSADAENDAQQAIAQQDYRLLVVASRGENTPGIDSSVARQVKQRCGKRYIPGSTDVIKSDQHLSALKRAYHYAANYNQIVVKHCSSK